MTDCSTVRRMIWTQDSPMHALAPHLDGCPECRTEMRRAEQMGVSLSSLATSLAEPPEMLEAQLLTLLSRSRMRWARNAVSHPMFWRSAAMGAAAAATAVGLVVAKRKVRPVAA
ncbi:MAG TPA: hypothetical protein VNE62_11000 [Actinomycetota bacterium]|nr:hypothetical protein [Actinomycetota bacterium]